MVFGQAILIIQLTLNNLIIQQLYTSHYKTFIKLNFFLLSLTRYSIETHFIILYSHYFKFQIFIFDPDNFHASL